MTKRCLDASPPICISMGAIAFLFFLSLFFFFFDVEPCGRKKTLTKSIKLNFLAKLKTEN